MRITLLALLFITVLRGQSGYDIAKMMDERKQPTDMTSKIDPHRVPRAPQSTPIGPPEHPNRPL